MGYQLDGWGSIADRDKRFFSSPQSPDRFWALILLFIEYREPGCEADPLSPPGAKVKNGGAMLPLPTCSAMAFYENLKYVNLK
jgi:hypothetical protein